MQVIPARSASVLIDEVVMHKKWGGKSSQDERKIKTKKDKLVCIFKKNKLNELSQGKK